MVFQDNLFYKNGHMTWMLNIYILVIQLISSGVALRTQILQQKIIQYNCNYSKLFLNLKPHSAIKVEAYFLKFQHNDVIQFSLDDQSIVYEEINIIQPTGNCGIFSLSNISIIHQHYRRSAWIKIFQNPGGIISFKLSILNFQEECIACISEQPINCIEWMLHQYSFNQKLMAYSDGWTFTPDYLNHTSFYCGGCQYLRFQEISYSTQLPPHKDVLIRLYKGSSNSISINYMYGNLEILSDVYN